MGEGSEARGILQGSVALRRDCVGRDDHTNVRRAVPCVFDQVSSVRYGYLFDAVCYSCICEHFTTAQQLCDLCYKPHVQMSAIRPKLHTSRRRRRIRRTRTRTGRHNV